MKVRDFLNQAYLLRTDEDPVKREELTTLQQFVSSDNAEVTACSRGLLVQDFLASRREPGTSLWGHGILYLIDHGKLMQLTDDEREFDSDRLLKEFATKREYYYNQHGPEKFIEDYKAGKFQNGSQPGDEN